MKGEDWISLVFTSVYYTLWQKNRKPYTFYTVEKK